MSAEQTSVEEQELTTTNILRMGLDELFPLVIGSIVSILSIWPILRTNYTTLTKVLLILLPVILSYIYLKYQFAPTPKKAYFLSILYDKNKSIETGFHHRRTNHWPFVGSAVIRINNIDHIFLGGGKGQEDALLFYNNEKGQFRNIIENTGLSDKNNATFSAVALDMDGDGRQDLIIGRSNGVFLYKQLDNMIFRKTSIVNKQDQVPLALSIADYNRDGRPDIYISYFTPASKYRGTVFNDPTHGRKNMLLQNITVSSNQIQFKDVTNETGASGMPYNTFTAAFIDLNNDKWPDLVLSHDSGEVEVLKNQEGQFKSIFPYSFKGNFMGLASGDVDSNGDQDLFLTNLGTDTPKNPMSLGDIQPNQKQTFQHVLLRNDGNFKFVETSKASGISGEGFGWGALFSDINLDGKLDLLFAENTKLYPSQWVFPKPGHYYASHQRPDHSTSESSVKNSSTRFQRKFTYKNPYFGHTPLLADINQDGIKDVIWVNMEGPAIAYLNKNKLKNNYLVVVLPETGEFINATVVLETSQGQQTRQVIQGGLGFGSDTSNIINFGLTKDDRPTKLTINTIYGKRYCVKDPKINSVVKLITK